MKTNIITLDEAIIRGELDWSKDNDCEFHGIIPGYVCGFNLEVEKDGKIGYGSTCFTNDFEEIRNPWTNDHWNDLGISEDLCNCNGWKSTGNIVFRGYYTEHYDFDDRETHMENASEEVKNIWNNFVVEG